MAGNPLEYMLGDLQAEYAPESVPPRIARLYEDDLEWGHMFGVLHKALNQHFDDVNRRIGNHYWADNSRDLIRLTDKIEQDLHTLRRGGVEVEFDPSYEEVLEACRPCSRPNGSDHGRSVRPTGAATAHLLKQPARVCFASFDRRTGAWRGSIQAPPS